MGKISVRNLQYGPLTRLVRGIYSTCYIMHGAIFALKLQNVPSQDVINKNFWIETQLYAILHCVPQSLKIVYNGHVFTCCENWNLKL